MNDSAFIYSFIYLVVDETGVLETDSAGFYFAIYSARSTTSRHFSLSLSYCCCLGLFRCISIFFTGNNRNNRVETTVKVAASTWRPQLRRVNEPMACLSESHILFDHFDP